MSTEIPDRNIRGALLLLLADMQCWKCAGTLRVGALAGQSHTEAWLDEAEPPRWLPFGEPAALQRVTSMSPGLEALVRRQLPTYHPAFSQTADMGYFMNHCPHCQASTGDFYAHAPDGPFFAWPRRGTEGIEIIELGDGEITAEPPYIIPPEFNLSPRQTRERMPKAIKAAEREKE